MSEKLSNKVRILTQLLNHNQSDQCELLVTLARLLEDRSKDQAWSIMTARKLILSTLNTHHPHINIARASEQWRQDHKDENEKQRRDRDQAPEIPYYS